MFPGRVVTFVQRKEKRPIHGITLPANHVSSAQVALLCCPILRYDYSIIIIPFFSSFVNVQPHRRGCSVCCDESVQQLDGYVFGRFSLFYLLHTFLQFSLVSIQFGLPTKRQNDVCLYVIPQIFPNALIWR